MLVGGCAEPRFSEFFGNFRISGNAFPQPEDYGIELSGNPLAWNSRFRAPSAVDPPRGPSGDFPCTRCIPTGDS